MILIAGGTGTLGRPLVHRLITAGRQVRVLTRDLDRARLSLPTAVELVHGDVRDRRSLERAIQGAELVISAVHGFTGGGNVSPASVDRDGNANLIDCCVACGAAVVLMSVVGASADSPLDLFRMKHLAEEELRRSKAPWTIVRASAFLETWIDLLEKTASGSGRPLVFGRGDNPINFVSVVDVVALLERVIADASSRGRVLEIGGPQDLTLNELASAVQRTAGRIQPPRHVPRFALRSMATLLRPIKPDLARQARAALVMDTVEMTVALPAARQLYRDLPATTLAEILAGSVSGVQPGVSAY